MLYCDSSVAMRRHAFNFVSMLHAVEIIVGPMFHAFYLPFSFLLPLKEMVIFRLLVVAKQQQTWQQKMKSDEQTHTLDAGAAGVCSYIIDVLWRNGESHALYVGNSDPQMSP